MALSERANGYLRNRNHGGNLHSAMEHDLLSGIGSGKLRAIGLVIGYETERAKAFPDLSGVLESITRSSLTSYSTPALFFRLRRSQPSRRRLRGGRKSG